MVDKKTGVEIKARIVALKSRMAYDPEINEHVTTFVVDCILQPAEFARILNLQKQGLPMELTIGSPQAAMDLRLDTINATTGEIMGEAERALSKK